MTKPEIYQDLKTLFLSANERLLKHDISLFSSQVSERTLCGALMLHLHQVLQSTSYSQYHVDVEYNRNEGGKLKTIARTTQGAGQEIIKITCDLIVHSRGECVTQDNLIAIEMKKSSRRPVEKEKDRERLMCLTKDSFDDIWSYDGETYPQHVCRYIMGVYYEVNYSTKKIVMDYYYEGRKESSEERCYGCRDAEEPLHSYV